MTKVQQYVRSLRRAGVPINVRIVMAAAEGIVKATDCTLLAQNGGHIKRGSSQVEVAGIGDKRQITITVAGTMSGQILPFQVLYEGKTERCHPSNSTFPEGFDVWHTPNQCADKYQMC